MSAQAYAKIDRMLAGIRDRQPLTIYVGETKAKISATYDDGERNPVWGSLAAVLQRSLTEERQILIDLEAGDGA